MKAAVTKKKKNVAAGKLVKMTLSWEPSMSEDVSAYDVYVRDTGKAGLAVKIGSTQSDSFTCEFPAGSTQEFQVDTVNAAGVSTMSEPQQFYCSDQAPVSVTSLLAYPAVDESAGSDKLPPLPGEEVDYEQRCALESTMSRESAVVDRADSIAPVDGVDDFEDLADMLRKSKDDKVIEAEVLGEQDDE